MTQCRHQLCADGEGGTYCRLCEKSAEVIELEDRIALLAKVLAAVNVAPEEGIVCPDIGNANWFDARDYALRAAGYLEGGR